LATLAWGRTWWTQNGDRKCVERAFAPRSPH